MTISANTAATIWWRFRPARAGRYVLVLALLAQGRVTAQANAKGVLDAAMTAMGATGLRSIAFTGSGHTFTHGQAWMRFGPLPRFDLKSMTFAADYVAPGSRVETVRAQGDNPPRGGSPQPIVGDQRAVACLNGEYAWGCAASGRETRVPGGQGLDADVVEQRQIQLWETPHGFLIAASKSGNATVAEKTIGGKRFRVVSFPRGKTHMDGYINDQNLVERVETWMAHPVQGDLSIETTFADYRDWNGLKFPTKYTERWGGETLLEMTISDVKPNVPVDVTVPASVRNTPLPPAVHIVTTKLEDGVYDIGGQNANTIAVDFKDYIVAIEAGTHQERSEGVIAEIHKLFPGKRIGYLINTHAQYNDHAGGVRPYAAEGATIVTHTDNVKWFEDVAFKGTWTIKPDRLSQTKTRPKIEGVDEKRVMSDGTRELDLYHVMGNQHDGTMLMIYMPKEKWLITADSYSTNEDTTPMFGPATPPPNAPPDFPRCCDARNFYDNVKRLNLDVKTIVPIHGVPAPWESFAKFLGRPS